MFFCLFCPPQKKHDEENNDGSRNLVVETTQGHHHHHHPNLHQHQKQNPQQQQQQSHGSFIMNGGWCGSSSIEKLDYKHARVSSLTPTINTMATTPTAGGSSSLAATTKQHHLGGGNGGGEISSLTSPTGMSSCHSRTKQTIIRTVDTFDSVLTEEDEEEEPLVGESIRHNHSHHHPHDHDQGSLTLTSYEKLETYLENLPEDTTFGGVVNTSDVASRGTSISKNGKSNKDDNVTPLTTPKSFMLPSPQSDTGSILVLTTDSVWFPPTSLRDHHHLHGQPQEQQGGSSARQEDQQQDTSPSSSPMTSQRDLTHPTNRIRTASAAWSSASSSTTAASSSSNEDSSSSASKDCDKKNRLRIKDRRNRIEHELSVIVQACADNNQFVHEFEDEAIEALGIAAMKVAYLVDDEKDKAAEDSDGLSIAYCILYGNKLMDVASQHYFGKFDDFVVAYMPVLRSSIQRLKNNLVTDTKYYDNNYTYLLQSIDNNAMVSEPSNNFCRPSMTTTTELVFRDQSNCWESP